MGFDIASAFVSCDMPQQKLWRQGNFRLRDRGCDGETSLWHLTGAAEWPLSMTARQVASSVIGLVGAESLGRHAERLRRFIDFLAGPHLQVAARRECRTM